MELGAPLWLAALVLVPLIRWLHRFRDPPALVQVAALWLYRREPEVDLEGLERREPHPVWRRRALIAGLLILALAQPRWPRLADAGVTVWLDDSLSMFAADAGTERMSSALERVESAMKGARVADWRVASLGDPAMSLDLSGQPAPERARALRAWAATARGEPQPPPPALMASTRRHWLVTDGADEGLAQWLARAPVERVIRVGEACANAAVTRLALRAPAVPGGPLQGLAEAVNACGRPAARTLAVRAGEAAVARWSLQLTGGERAQRTFELPAETTGALRAELDATDALPADDRLALDIGALAPLAVALRGHCPAAVDAALRRHPRLRVLGADAAGAGLRIACDGAPARLDPPVLRLHGGGPAVAVAQPAVWRPAAGKLAELILAPEWTRVAAPPPPGPAAGTVLLAAGAVPLVRTAGTGALEVFLDLGSPELTARPELPALLAGLVDHVSERELLGEILLASRAPEASRIEPRPLPPEPDGLTEAATTSVDLSVLALAAAALLMLLDAWRMRRTRYWLLACAALAALALWNPTLPGGRRPLQLLLLLDESSSMPEDAAAAAWSRVRSAATRFAADSRLDLIRFAARPALHGGLDSARLPAIPPGAGPPDAGATDIAAALEAALRTADTRYDPVLVVASDGQQNASDATRLLRRASAAGLPVLALPPATRITDAAGVDRLQVPRRAAAGRRVPVVVEVANPHRQPATLDIQVDGAIRATMAIASGGGASTAVHAWLRAEAPGIHRVTAVLRASDGTRLGAREALLEVDGRRPVLYVTRTPESAPAAASLLAGGWPVVRATPATLAQQQARLVAPGLVVLDDIAIDDAPEAAWDVLAAAVTSGGSGLLVLGGPNSFGAGGYRHSRLESLLPVVAERPRRQPATAVLFVVDKSGSMGRQIAGPSRLSLARRAVTQSAGLLAAGDPVGLIAFDVEPRWLLPLQAGGATHLESAWTFGASGGTVLVPALEDAVTALAASAAPQRLLVLVTDGFVPGDGLEPLAARIAGSGIDVIALAIGEDADPSVLHRLAGLNQGRLLAVTDVTELPRLMTREVALRGPGVARGPVRPNAVAPLPFMPDPPSVWPWLDAYPLTTARPSARVHLANEYGDPLLAVHEAGAGRVAALPGGLGGWAASWYGWPALPRFLGGLAQWLNAPASSRLHAVAEYGEAGVVLRVDAVEADGAWSGATGIVHWRDPGGRLATLPLARLAPGRLEARLPLTRPGPYAGTVQVGDERLPLGFLHGPRPEQEPTPAQQAQLAAWQAAGLLQRWPDDDRLARPRLAGRSARALLVVLTLGAFLIMLLHPRIRETRSWAILRSR